MLSEPVKQRVTKFQPNLIPNTKISFFSQFSTFPEFSDLSRFAIFYQFLLFYGKMFLQL